MVDLILEHFEHVLEPLLVESVGASLPFLTPILVGRSEEERTSEQVAEILLVKCRLLNLIFVLVPEV